MLIVSRTRLCSLLLLYLMSACECGSRDGVEYFHSGLIVPERRGNETVPEVAATSGYALLHFFSDAAYNLTGFEIYYS